MNPPISRPTLALCLIARDEAEMIGDCLSSLDGRMNQVIVVDTGSRDRTAEIARQEGAEVYHHPWTHDFAASRNAALKYVNSDWVLVLDADERLAPGAARALCGAIAQAEFDCGFLPLHNAASLDALPHLVLSGEQRRGEPVLLPRLFRFSGDLKWEGAVHETPASWFEQGRKAVQINAPIIHLGNVPDLREGRKKAQRNKALLERQCQIQPNDPVARTYLSRELLRAGETERARDAIERAWTSLVERLNRPQGPRPAMVATTTLRAFLLLEQQANLQALNILSHAKSLGVEHPNLSLLSASALEQIGDADSLDQAAASLEKCLSMGSEIFLSDLLPGATTWAAWNLLGLVRLRQGRAPEALAAFKAASQSQSPKALTQIGRSLALAGCGRSNQALEGLESLLLPTVADGWIAAAIACLSMRNFSDASTFLERADHAGRATFSYLDQIRRRAWAHVRAQEWLNDLIEGPPPPVDRPAVTLVELGEKRFSDGDIDGSIDLFLRALSKDSSLPEAWTSLGVVFHARGYCEHALNAFHAALSLDPHNPDTRFNLGLFQVELGRMSEAAHQFRSLVLEDPDHEEAREALRSIGVEGDLPPMALVVSTPGSTHLRTAVRAGLMLSGWHERDATPDILRALGPRRQREEAIRKYLATTRPGLLVLDPSARQAAQWRTVAAEYQVPTALFPWGQDPAPQAPQPLLRLPEDTDSILRAFPKAAAPAPTPESATSSEPLLSVVARLGPRPEAHLQLLDRLAVQHLDPCFFEVILLGPAARVEELSTPSRRLTVRGLEGDPTLERALEACRGRWVVLLDDQGLPEVDTLRRHLVAQLSTPDPTAIVGDHVYTAVPYKALSNLFSRRPDLAHGGVSTTGSTVLLFQDTNCSFPLDCLANLSPPHPGVPESREGQTLDFAARLAISGVTIERAPHIQVRHFEEPSLDALKLSRAARGAARFEAWSSHGGDSLLSFEPAAPLGDVKWMEQRSVAEALNERATRNESALRSLIAAPLPSAPALQIKRLNRVGSALLSLLNATERKGLVSAATNQVIHPDVWRTRPAGVLLSVLVLLRPGSGSPLPLINSLREHTDGVVEVLLVDLGTQQDLSGLDLSDCVRLQGLEGSSTARLNRAMSECSGQELLICEPHQVIRAGWRNHSRNQLYSWDDIAALVPQIDENIWPACVSSSPFLLLQSRLWRLLGGLLCDLEDDRLALVDLLLRAQLIGLRLRASECLPSGERVAPSDLDSTSLEILRARWKLDDSAPGWSGFTASRIRNQPDDLRRILTHPAMGEAEQPAPPSVLLRTRVTL